MPNIFFNARKGAVLKLWTEPPSGAFSVRAIPWVDGLEGSQWNLPHDEPLVEGCEYTIHVFALVPEGVTVTYKAIVENPDPPNDPEDGPYRDLMSRTDPTDTLIIPRVG